MQVPRFVMAFTRGALWIVTDMQTGRGWTFYTYADAYAKLEALRRDKGEYIQ